MRPMFLFSRLSFNIHLKSPSPSPQCPLVSLLCLNRSPLPQPERLMPITCQRSAQHLTLQHQALLTLSIPISALSSLSIVPSWFQRIALGFLFTVCSPHKFYEDRDEIPILMYQESGKRLLSSRASKVSDG